MSSYALQLKDLRKSFGKSEIIRGVNLDVPVGERLAIIGPNGAGKSTLFNLISGRFEPTSGDILLNGQRINGKKPFEINRMGLSRSFQITNIFPKLSVFENLRCSVLWSLGYKYTFLKFLADLDDANARTEELMAMIKLDKKRDVLAANLTYAEQRALEIGVTIGGGASVILLDEPTAGMSKTETTRFISLIKEVTVGKTLLTVEHDMGVVFGLADKIAVVVYGEVLAYDTPDAVRANQRVCKKPTWEHRLLKKVRNMLSINNLHAYYGKSHVLHGVSFQIQPGEIVALLGRNGSGRSTTAKAIMGLVHWEGDLSWKGDALKGKKAFEIAHMGVGYVPENRDIFPTLTVRQNLLLGQKGAGKGSRWTFDDMFAMFPRLREREHTEAGVLSGGEQQMLTLCRTLMGDPDLIIIDEPTEGLAPKIVELVGQYLKTLRSKGVSVLLIEQKLTIAMAISDRALVMGHGSIVFEGTPDSLRQDASIRKEWLEV
jgi:branched-chain amino acid transport system ATP-binding protein